MVVRQMRGNVDVWLFIIEFPAVGNDVHYWLANL